MSLSGAGQFVAQLATVHSCAQLGDCTLMCPVGRLYTHVPSWAIVHSCAQLGDCTHMCPVGRLYTHVPSWAIVHTCAQLGNGTLLCPVGQWYTRSQYNAHVQLDYSSDPFGILSRIKMCIKLEIIAVTKPTAATLVLST